MVVNDDVSIIDEHVSYVDFTVLVDAFIDFTFVKVVSDYFVNI